MQCFIRHHVILIRILKFWNLNAKDAPWRDLVPIRLVDEFLLAAITIQITLWHHFLGNWRVVLVVLPDRRVVVGGLPLLKHSILVVIDLSLQVDLLLLLMILLLSLALLLIFDRSCIEILQGQHGQMILRIIALHLLLRRGSLDLAFDNRFILGLFLHLMYLLFLFPFQNFLPSKLN